MKTSLTIVVLALTVLLAVSVPCEAQWDNEIHVNEMSGEKMCVASSPDTPPTKQMDFPYREVKASLIYQVKPDGIYNRVAVVFTALNLDHNSYYNFGAQELDIQIKFDDDKPWWYPVHRQDNYLFFDRKKTEELVTKIKEGSTLLIELSWYDQGKVYFRFSLNGSTNAINTARSQCGLTD